MHHHGENRSVRERIIAAEVKKLELRQARRRTGDAQRGRPDRRELSAGRGH